MRDCVIRANIIWFGYRNKKMNQWFINCSLMDNMLNQQMLEI